MTDTKSIYIWFESYLQPNISTKLCQPYVGITTMTIDDFDDLD